LFTSADFVKPIADRRGLHGMTKASALGLAEKSAAAPVVDRILSSFLGDPSEFKS
jgi:hypothetical protein